MPPGTICWILAVRDVTPLEVHGGPGVYATVLWVTPHSIHPSSEESRSYDAVPSCDRSWVRCKDVHST
jgi:hypothetical protein